LSMRTPWRAWREPLRPPTRSEAGSLPTSSDPSRELPPDAWT